MLGFAKNERVNIDAAELKALQELAKHYLGLDDRQIEQAIASGVLTEVHHDHEKA
ncbi:type II toxin-antitoxin system RelE/ParE family toxin [Thiobacter sp. AK1]|uniref:Type II toxin-antitoxin system RelE/ParE family toxin n=1 Tax=Thiobacter aerophilum TaxID=3121275 RepID=A0ABV0EH71_9BURK